MSRTFHHGDRAKERRFGALWHWIRNEPAWWTRLFMTRPQKRKANAEVKKILADGKDRVIPHGNKPHKYYW